MIDEKKSEYLTIEQVAELIHMSGRAIRMKLAAGKLKAYKPGKRLLFKREDVEKFIRSHPAA